MGFKGEYLNKFDEAGRISLPAKMREDLKSSNLGDTLVCFYAVNTKCLKLLPKSTFEKWEQQYLDNPPKDKISVEVFRYIFASSVELDINGSGRINIPQKHRQKAMLSEECYVIGVNDQIQLWNKDMWEEETLKIEAALAENIELPADLSGYLLF